MEKLRNVFPYSLNKGTLQARGLFNVSNSLLLEAAPKGGVSFWFDDDTKDELFRLNDLDFKQECKKLINEAF